MTFLPEMDQEYLHEKGYSYREVVEGPNRGLIIQNWLLPQNKYDQERTDLLILLPIGYPDAPPDMFYLNPWIRIRNNGQYAKNADVPFSLDGKQWQRWSRHSPNTWRGGIDGIITYLKKVQNALEVA